MHELMFQAGVKGMSERSELIPCSHDHNHHARLSKTVKGVLSL